MTKACKLEATPHQFADASDSHQASDERSVVAFSVTSTSPPEDLDENRYADDVSTLPRYSPPPSPVPSCPATLSPPSYWQSEHVAEEETQDLAVRTGAWGEEEEEEEEEQ